MSAMVLRERVYAGEVPVIEASHASRRLAERALELACDAFGCTRDALPSIHARLDAEEIWRRTCLAREALVTDAQARAAALDLAHALGFEMRSLAYDAPRLRVVAPNAHENAAAARAFYTHRDTWYGSPRQQINAWVPLFDVDERDSLALYPRAFGVEVDNDSADFDYEAFRRAGGFQSAAAIASAYPRCTSEPGSPLRVRARAGEVVVFSAAQLHGTAPNAAGRTRFSVDVRFVDLTDREQGLGAPDPDNRSRGSALADYRRPTFARAFADVARTHAERVAIEEPNAKVTYAELDARARAVARELSRQGVARGDVVGIRKDKSIDLVVEMLGAWYAGAAFVVLPKELPDERSARMLRDCAGRLGDGDLAYVVFTSGTTGDPKGVMVEHRGIVPMLAAQIAEFRIEPGSRCFWMLSPAFDASISDVGTALLAGATLVIDPAAAALSPAALLSRLGELAISHVDLPPALLSILDERELPASVKTIIIGGEVCPDEIVSRFAARARLVSVYGPTEATVCTSMRVCVAGEPHGARLGRPISTARYRVVDARMHDVAPEATGELLITGACLARGYAGDAELTSRRFVTLDGERFYRTGDAVRLLPDGETAFVGRLDRQVKVAGVRVEPEEIEAHLRADPGVAEAAVTRRGRTLAAYVALRHPRTDPDLRALRARLRARVPPWLVPARFVEVGGLPRGASGKVTLAALEPARSIEPPRDPLEKLLCEAMAGALELPEVGRDEDFFVLGGDSLAVLDACAFVEAAGVTLEPAILRRAKTAAAAAAAVGATDAMPASELAREITAARSSAVTVRSAAGARSILLTGATGQLGARLLRELEAAGVMITCLVRAADDEAAASRIGKLAPRTRVVAGDVRRERLGLDSPRYAQLLAEIDTVVHAAAEVDLTAPLSALRASNVEGTAHVLAFARGKSLHYVSTLSVFASTDLARREGGSVFTAERSVYDASIVYGGYAQSKWVAEALVRKALGDGASIHRLGLLTGDSHGSCGRHDLVAAFVRGVVAVGALPGGLPDQELRFDVTPVDFAARSLSHFVTSGGEPRTRHLANRRTATLRELLEVMRHEGAVIERVDVDQWRARAREVRLRGIEAAVVRACADRGAHRSFDLFEATGCDFASGETLDDLARAGIACPDPSALLPAYVRRALAEASA